MRSGVLDPPAVRSLIPFLVQGGVWQSEAFYPTDGVGIPDIDIQCPHYWTRPFYSLRLHVKWCVEMDDNDKIYTERKILAGVLLGGSVAGAYYFWHTFRALGKPRHAIAAVIVAAAVLIVTFASIFVPVLDKVPNAVFHGLQSGIALGSIRAYLSTEIDAHIAGGKTVYGWGNTILVAIVSMIITLGPLLAFLYISPATFDNSTTRYYGRLKHEIVFDPSNLNELEVGRIAAALTSTGYFDEEKQKTVDAAKSGNRFIITVYCNNDARAPETIELYKMWRSELQESFPSNPIVIDMVVGTTDDRIARLE